MKSHASGKNFRALQELRNVKNHVSGKDFKALQKSWNVKSHASGKDFLHQLRCVGHAGHMADFDLVEGIGGKVLGSLLQISDSGGTCAFPDDGVQSFLGYTALVLAQTQAFQYLGQSVA